MANKKIITRFTYNSLRNEAHVEFHEENCKIIEKFNPRILGIETPYAEYQKAYEDEIQLLDLIRKSEFTQEIVKQDEERDNIFFGFKSAVNSAKVHHDRSLRPTAEKINFVLDRYGNIARKRFNEETAAIDDLIRELRSSKMEEINVLKLNDWVLALERENNKFKQLISSRTEESAKMPTLRMVNARLIVDKLFRTIINYIEAVSVLSDNGKYDEFIKELNVTAQRYKKLI